MKDVAACESVGELATSIDPAMSEWGNPPARVLHGEYIAMQGEPGELKYLSNRRKRNQPRFRQ